MDKKLKLNSRTLAVMKNVDEKNKFIDDANWTTERGLALINEVIVLRKEVKRLQSVEQASGAYCNVCGWNGIRGDEQCAFCEVNSIRLKEQS